MILTDKNSLPWCLALVMTMLFGIASCELKSQSVEGVMIVDVRMNELLANPSDFDNRKISVAGVLLWHEDEPTLFADWESYEDANFANSLQLQIPRGFEYEASKAHMVIVGGTFYYDRDFFAKNYKGVFRIESIVQSN